MENTNELFTVMNITHAKKPGYVVTELKYSDSGSSSYTFVRKDYGGYTIIQGYKISFKFVPGCDKAFYKGMEKQYETAGKKVTDTSNNKKGIKDSIKEEATQKEIQIPEVVVPVDYTKEVFHHKFDKIKLYIENEVPVFLVGEAGTGKNHTLEQIANQLGYNFYFTNSVQQEYKLTGFIDAGGNYHETEFYKACKEATEGKDTVFFLDEMDASIPEVLVLLNAAIANGYFEFPNGKLTFGKKVHFVSAGNTVGSGADELYTGRMVIDQATLDRFAIIPFDYDINIEMALAKGNKDLVDFIEAIRKQSKEKGIRATFSYRCITMVMKMEAAGADLASIMEEIVFKGLDKDTIKTFSAFGESKYFKAFQQLKFAA